MRRVQEHLVDEVQSVYLSEGAPIHDKHIEIIIRQMLRRVTVIESGDSDLLAGDLVDRLLDQGGEPAGRGSRWQPGLGTRSADGDHQGIAGDRAVVVGCVLPGDHQGADHAAIHAKSRTAWRV